MSTVYFPSRINSSCKSIRESRNCFFFVKIESKWVGNLLYIDVDKSQWTLNNCKIYLNDFTAAKLKKPGFHSRKHSSIPVELWERKLAPGLSSIQYLFMNFASKLLPIAFITMHHQVITKFFYCVCV